MIDERAIGFLLDKDQIREIVGPRYGRAMDWYDLDLLKSCFHPDATLDYGYFKGNAHEWCETRVRKDDPDVLNWFHYVFPPQIEIDDDVAESEANGIGGRRVKDAGTIENYVYGLKYLDRLERRSGTWRLSHRVLKIDFALVLPGDSGPGDKFVSIPFMAQASPSHPDYRRLFKP